METRALLFRHTNHNITIILNIWNQTFFMVSIILFAEKFQNHQDRFFFYFRYNVKLKSNVFKFNLKDKYLENAEPAIKDNKKFIFINQTMLLNLLMQKSQFILHKSTTTDYFARLFRELWFLYKALPSQKQMYLFQPWPYNLKYFYVEL